MEKNQSYHGKFEKLKTFQDKTGRFIRDFIYWSPAVAIGCGTLILAIPYILVAPFITAIRKIEDKVKT